jgi:hypothetical protein
MRSSFLQFFPRENCWPVQIRDQTLEVRDVASKLADSSVALQAKETSDIAGQVIVVNDELSAIAASRTAAILAFPQILVFIYGDAISAPEVV